MKFGFENNKVANMCKCTKKYRSKQNKNKNKIQRLLEIIPFNDLRQSYTLSPDLFTPPPLLPQENNPHQKFKWPRFITKLGLSDISQIVLIHDNISSWKRPRFKGRFRNYFALFLFWTFVEILLGHLQYIIIQCII